MFIEPPPSLVVGGEVRSRGLTPQRGGLDSFLEEVSHFSGLPWELQIARENTTTKQKAPSKFLFPAPGGPSSSLS